MLISEAFNKLDTNSFVELINKVLSENTWLQASQIDDLVVFKLAKLWSNNNVTEYPCSSNVYCYTNNNYTSVTRIFHNKEEAEIYLQDATTELTKFGYGLVNSKTDNINKKFVVSYTVVE
jgi:hypothetical protein